MFDIFSKLFGGAQGAMPQALGPNGPVPMGAPMGGPPQMTPGMMAAAGSNFDPAQGGRVGPGMALNPGATMAPDAYARMGIGFSGPTMGKNTMGDAGPWARAYTREPEAKPTTQPPAPEAPPLLPMVRNQFAAMGSGGGVGRQPAVPNQFSGIGSGGGVGARLVPQPQQAQADPQQMQKMGPLFAMLMQRQQGGMA